MLCALACHGPAGASALFSAWGASFALRRGSLAGRVAHVCLLQFSEPVSWRSRLPWLLSGSTVSSRTSSVTLPHKYAGMQWAQAHPPSHTTERNRSRGDSRQNDNETHMPRERLREQVQERASPGEKEESEKRGEKRQEQRAGSMLNGVCTTGWPFNNGLEGSLSPG